MAHMELARRKAMAEQNSRQCSSTLDGKPMTPASASATVSAAAIGVHKSLVHNFNAARPPVPSHVQSKHITSLGKVGARIAHGNVEVSGFASKQAAGGALPLASHGRIPADVIQSPTEVLMYAEDGYVGFGLRRRHYVGTNATAKCNLPKNSPQLVQQKKMVQQYFGGSANVSGGAAPAPLTLDALNQAELDFRISNGVKLAPPKDQGQFSMFPVFDHDVGVDLHKLQILENEAAVRHLLGDSANSLTSDQIRQYDLSQALQNGNWSQGHELKVVHQSNASHGTQELVEVVHNPSNSQVVPFVEKCMLVAAIGIEIYTLLTGIYHALQTYKSVHNKVVACVEQVLERSISVASMIFSVPKALSAPLISGLTKLGLSATLSGCLVVAAITTIVVVALGFVVRFICSFIFEHEVEGDGAPPCGLDLIDGPPHTGLESAPVAMSGSNAAAVIRGQGLPWSC